MSKFQPGDLVTRSQHNSWWMAICAREYISPNDVFVVRTCGRATITCEGWQFAADPAYFTLARKLTKEEIIAARIKKLYSKCKTTAHWV